MNLHPCIFEMFWAIPGIILLALVGIYNDPKVKENWFSITLGLFILGKVTFVAGLVIITANIIQQIKANGTKKKS